MALYERMNTIALINTYVTTTQGLFASTAMIYGLGGEVGYTSRQHGMCFKVGQTGTNEANILSTIRAKLGKKGTCADSIYCTVYLADANHKPTGNVLAASSHPQQDIQALESWGEGIEVDFIMTPTYNLQPDTEYCFVLKSPLTNFQNGYYVATTSIASGNE